MLCTTRRELSRALLIPVSQVARVSSACGAPGICFRFFPDAPCWPACYEMSVHLGTRSHLFCRSRCKVLRWVNKLQLIERSQHALPASSVLFHFDGGREIGVKFENI